MYPIKSVISVFFLVIIINLQSALAQSEQGTSSCRLNCENSTIWGKLETDRNETTEYCSFYNIPYAKPPLADLRFQRAELEESCPSNEQSWNITPIICTQVTKFDIMGQEDCLYLNVFTKWGSGRDDEESSTTLSPVVLWIHGGSFVVGSGLSDNFHPAALVEEDIVVVSFNYRLHLFGFFPVAPEEPYSNNLGLDDQRVVLQWIQKHIRWFGGDPNRVTIMGWSAGSASVNYLMYDESAKGLFHAAIAISGSFLSSWAFSHNAMEIRERLCKHFLIGDCSLTRIQRTMGRGLKYLMLLEDYDVELKNVIWGCQEFNYRPMSEQVGDFPEARMKNGFLNDVPLLMGVTNDELMRFELGHYLGHIKQQPSAFPNSDPKVLENILQLLRREWNDSEESFRADLSFANMYHGVYKFVELHANRSGEDIFFYRLNHNTRDGTTVGSDHSDTIDLLFGEYDPEVPFNTHVAKHVQTIWINFIKYQNPTINGSDNDHENAELNNRLSLIRINKTTNVRRQMTDSPLFDRWDEILDCVNYFRCPKYLNGGGKVTSWVVLIIVFDIFLCISY